MSIDKFIFDLINKAKEHKIKIILDPNKVEYSEGSEVSGLFDSENLEITVGINKSVDEWLPILVHESCHMDQYIENCKAWVDTSIKNFDAGTILDMWLEHLVELNPDQLSIVVDKVLEMELDCEKRSIEKIKKYKLPIDITEYTQKANAYMYFYRALIKTRKWSTKVSPYKSEQVWKNMPNKLYDNNSFYKTDNPLVDIIIKECFN